MLSKDTKIYIAGHRGMVGSACWRLLEKEGFVNLIGKTSSELDLRNDQAVEEFLGAEKPDIVIDAAARVGGILANSTYPYEFLLDNMLIQNNLIRYSHELGVKKFVFLGSSCIYPKFAPQPIKESHLLTDSLERTNESYALAKIAGVKLIESLRNQYGRDYVSLMPSNLYGPNDNYDLNNSHVLPAMIRKFHEAKINGTEVNLWGDGSALREFLYVDDLAEAVLFFLKNSASDYLYNVGGGSDLTIKALAGLVMKTVGFEGEVKWDLSKPNGTPRKIMDSSKILEMGWSPRTNLNRGIELSYLDYLKRVEKSL